MTNRKYRTILMNPRWTFRAHSGLTNMSSINQITTDEIAKFKLDQFFEKDANTLLFLMCSPTAVATGKHVEATKNWKYKPQTTGVWRVTNPMGSGRSHLDDSCYFYTICKRSGRFYKKDTKSIHPRFSEQESTEFFNDDIYSESPLVGSRVGASYGEDFHKHIESIGYGPYLEIWPRKFTTCPDNWDRLIPTAEHFIV